MNFRESYAFVKNLDNLSSKFINDMARLNQMCDEEYKKALLNRVYFMQNLTQSQREFILSRANLMDEDEIEVIEHVNHASIRSLIHKFL